MARTHGLADTLGNAIDRLAASRLASLAAILIVALVAFVPGVFALAPMDGDEPGYAVAARAMLETGDFSSVRLQTENAEWRPRGPYWVQAFFLSLAGPNPPIWVDRLPSLIAAVLAVVLTWWLALALASPRAALLAALFVAGASLVGFEARLATADAILLAATILTAGALARVWASPDGNHTGVPAVLFWSGLGVGILAKGIVAPAMAVGAIVLLTLQRGSHQWLARLRPSTGVVWLFLIVSPWLIAVVLTFLQGSGEGPSAEFLERLGVPFQVYAPPGSYVLLLPLLAGPSAVFLFVALSWVGRSFKEPAVLFAVAWGGPLWLAAELLPAKLPHVVLPALPAVALIAAVAVEAGAARIGGWVSWLFFSLALVVVPLAVAVGLPLAFFLIEDRLPVAATILFVAGAALAWIAWWWLRAGKAVASAVMSVAAAVVIYSTLFGAYLPGLSDLRVGERLAAAARDSVQCYARSFAVAGYPEESVVLALGPRTRIVDAWSAADFLNTTGCQIAAVDASQITSFRQHAEDIGLKVADRGHVKGVDLRKMRIVDVHLFTADRTP